MEPEQRRSSGSEPRHNKNRCKNKNFLRKKKAEIIQSMNSATNFEHRASSSRSKHEGEPSLGLCDRLDRTRDNSQRQLPTDHDYAVPTREYQTDQSSLKSAQAAARPVLKKRKRQLQNNLDHAELTRSLHIRAMHSSKQGYMRPERGLLVTTNTRPSCDGKQPKLSQTILNRSSHNANHPNHIRSFQTI